MSATHLRIAAFNASADEKRDADRECTGSSDQVVIQNMLDSGFPVSVELSSGDFNFSGKLTIRKPGLVFKGQGKRTTIHRVLPHSGHLIEAQAGPRLKGVTIRDLAFNDNGAALHSATSPDTSTIKVWNAENVRLTRLYLSDIYRTGILVLNSDDVVVEECVTRDAKATRAQDGNGGDGGLGIKLFSGTHTNPNDIPSRNNVVRNCEVTGCWRVGIWSAGIEGLAVTGNHVYDNNQQAAVDANIEAGGQIGLGPGCSMADISENHIHGGATTIGIEFDVTKFFGPNTVPINWAIISRNRIHDVGLCGILIVSDGASPQLATHLLIESNIITRSTLRSPPAWGSITITEKISNFAVRGNMIVEQKHPACLIRKGASHYVVDGNHFEATGMALQSAKGAFQDDGIGAKSVSGNLLLVNGKAVV